MESAEYACNATEFASAIETKQSAYIWAFPAYDKHAISIEGASGYKQVLCIFLQFRSTEFLHPAVTEVPAVPAHMGTRKASQQDTCQSQGRPRIDIPAALFVLGVCKQN